ncbi:phosphohydrolase [Desulfurococcus amylolyticus]|uniref:phosphohydrolase n=1 Tax=Desulfurococcus amylolyticus TaxID=94694 RepID=UPI0023F5531A|nr:phosphohydrolase [Desulfurococcus amylolyticus]
MVLVNSKLIESMLSGNPFLKQAYTLLVNDPEVQALWSMANVMAVNRLKYNDHGSVHAHIAAGASLYIYQLLLSKGVQPSLLKDGVVDNIEYTWLIPLIGSLLHDIGNSIHRDMHERIGALLAIPIIERVLEKLITDQLTRTKLRQEIAHAIYCTSYDVECLTYEAGCVKVGDGVDMAEGRARVPYRLGGISIHSVSALSIKSVEILPSERFSVRINVNMTERAGIFQVDEILIPKISSTPLKNHVEVYTLMGGSVVKSYTPS